MSEPLNTAVTARARFTQAGAPFTPASAPTCTVYLLTGAADDYDTPLVEDATTVDEGGFYFAYTLASGSNVADGMLLFEFVTSDTNADDETLSAYVRVTDSGGGASVEDIFEADPTDYDADADSFAALILAIAAAANLIGSAEVHYVGSVSPAGRVTVYQGRDYAIVDGTALPWTTSSTLNLATATVTLDFNGVSFPATVTGSGGAWTIRAEITAEESEALPVGVYGYELSAVLANTHVPPPLGIGSLQVIRDN